MNSEFDRPITHQLYGGDWGKPYEAGNYAWYWWYSGAEKTGYRKTGYHCNEGHAALINVQRLVDLIAGQGLTFARALEVVRASSLYTVHTLCSCWSR